MSTNSKQFMKGKILLSIGAFIVGGSTIFIFSIPQNECSQLITNAIIFYNTMMMHSCIKEELSNERNTNKNRYSMAQELLHMNSSIVITVNWSQCTT